MLALMLALSLGQFDSGDAPRASAMELRRVHDLMSGKWEIVSIEDNGESLGRELVRRRFAKDGRVIIGERLISIESPENGAKREIAFRIDTSTTPRSIEVIGRDDELLKGIFKFEDDDLIICVAHHQKTARPDAFEAGAGTDRMLFRLRLPAINTKTATADPEFPAFDPLPAAVTVAETTKPQPASETVKIEVVESKPAVDTAAIAPAARRPSESELRRAHEMLNGDWTITSLVDNGQSLGTDLIRAKFADNGRIHFGSNFVTLASPRDETKHLSVYQIDPTTTPSRMDVTTQLDSVLKGIYKFDGDDLIVCLGKYSDVERPSAFEAPAGSERMLFRLLLAKPEPAPSAPPPPAAPSAAEVARERENTVRNMLIGSWNYTDRKGTVTIVLRPDGTFIATREWSKALKKMFEGTTTSEGRWSYGNSYLSCTVNRTQDRKMLGHSFAVRIESIGDNSSVFKDSMGEILKARKLR